MAMLLYLKLHLFAKKKNSYPVFLLLFLFDLFFSFLILVFYLDLGPFYIRSLRRVVKGFF
jgi:hypothetical protein